MAQKKAIIAIASIRYFDIHKEQNVEKIKQFIRKAKRLKADIICFPETCITKKERLVINHQFIKEIGAECKKNKIWCIVTEDVKFKGEIYNTSVLIGRDGKVKGHYEKINLHGDDTKAGKQVRVFKTDFGKIGIVICWDLTFPALFNEMRKKGAEIVFCPAKWHYEVESHEHSHKKKELALLRAMTLARAHENVFYVALCNPYLGEKDHVAYSAIADPNGILVELIDKEGMITATVEPGLIQKFRKHYRKT